MKQIFDWLREQIKNRKSKDNFLEDKVWNHAMRVCIEIVDEAEAKLESDCCEWKLSRTRLRKFDEYMWVTSCSNGTEIFGIPHFVVKHYNVCPYCGKPIKISEVE